MAKSVTVYVIIELFGGCYGSVILASTNKERRDSTLLDLVCDTLGVVKSLIPDTDEFWAQYEEYLTHPNKDEYYADEFALELPEPGRGFRLSEIGSCSEEELDDYVIDCKLDEASCINNAGREAQTEYLTGG